MLRPVIGALTLIVATACAPVEMHEQMAQPVQTVMTAGIGDQVLRINRSEDLPNAFGRADLFGRKRDAGFTAVRLVGIENGKPVFERREVEIRSNETTMSRSGVLIGTTSASAHSYGNTATFQGTTTAFGAADDEIMAFPAETLRFQVDWPSERSFVAGGRTVDIVEVSGGFVRYGLR
jgi:hypothetical protein